MALTPEQEADLLKSNEDMKTALAALPALTAQLDTFKTELAAKDTALKDLQTKTSTLTQDAASSALKAKFPDVPLETLLALPEASREAQGKLLQDTMGKFKSAHPALKTGPDAWAGVGGVGPSVEAEEAAALAARETERAKAVQGGNFMDVLRIKSRDTVEFIAKNFASR